MATYHSMNVTYIAIIIVPNCPQQQTTLQWQEIVNNPGAGFSTLPLIPPPQIYLSVTSIYDRSYRMPIWSAKVPVCTASLS